MSLIITILLTGTLLQIIAAVFLVSYAWLAIAVIFMLIAFIVHCILIIFYDRYKRKRGMHYVKYSEKTKKMR
jgi:amino acid transporter